MFSRVCKSRLFSQDARIEDGLRVYAVGDIHGRIDLLERLLSMIEADAADNGHEKCTNALIYLGDYVDRGLHARAVIERVSGPPPAGFTVTLLRGNHEDSMQRFLKDPGEGARWLSFGGVTTLASYGVAAYNGIGAPSEPAKLSAQLRAAMPPHHVAFLADLRLSMTIGDYMFVHAGIRPGVALEAQDPEDLLWIREPFLSSTVDHGKVIVHGHTISPAPEVLGNRIGIDTGAYHSGRLTCLVLEAATQRFLQTGM